MNVLHCFESINSAMEQVIQKSLVKPRGDATTQNPISFDS
jgi:hypothetical protein